MNLAEKRVMEKLQPYLKEVQTVKRTNLETMLDQSCPDWRVYEDDMMANLKAHPTLVNDPVKLYQLSVPSNVLESRATQKALKKLQTKSGNGQVSGGSTTTKTPSQMPTGPMTFDDAVKAAKAKLQADGVSGLG